MSELLLEDYNFGCADADTEYSRPEPEGFAHAVFYDPRGIVNTLVGGAPFLVVGRKGTGKTAIGNEVKLREGGDFRCKRVNLTDFQFKTFGRLGSNRNTGDRYSFPWRLMLLLQLMEALLETERAELYPREFLECVRGLQKHGLVGSGVVGAVRVLAKPSFRVGVGDLSVAAVGTESELELRAPGEIAEVVEKRLLGIPYGTLRILIVFDGLDDVLRGKHPHLEVMSGLIRAAGSLNTLFVQRGVPAKYLVMVRPEVLALCNDPDLNKIQRDSQVELTWHRDADNPKNSDLMHMVTRRMVQSGTRVGDISPWHTVMPRTLNKMDSWKHVLLHTLLRPRDIIQFLKECQEMFPRAQKLSPVQVRKCLRSYASRYLLTEMKNELVGFLDEGTIQQLPGVLASLASREFSAQVLGKACTDCGVKQSAKPILATLYDLGYVGQLITDHEGKRAPSFRYRDNPHIAVNLNTTFLLHRGLGKAFDVGAVRRGGQSGGQVPVCL